MKKFLAAVSAAFLTAAVFANDIFAGKSFDGIDQSVYYKFGGDNTAELMSGNDVGAVLNYKLDERKKTITLFPKKVDSTSLGIIGFENRLCEKKEILDFINKKDFERDALNKMLEEECGFDPKIELGSKDEVEQILNCIVFVNYREEAKTEEAYDKSVDYTEKLREELKKNEDQEQANEQIKEVEEFLASIKAELESTTIPQVKSMKKKIEARLDTIFDTEIIFNYKENEDGSILLTEEAENVSANVVFLSMNSANEDKHVYINSSILATADVDESGNPIAIKFFTTGDKCKKDSGKVTFVNSDGKKDKLKAAYSISRSGNEIEITLKINSGSLKGTELKSTYKTSTETLTPRG